MSRPSPLSFARKKAWQRKRIVAPLRCRGLIDAFEKSFAKPLWKKFHWGFSFARKKAWQRKRIVAPLRCRGLIDVFEKSFAKPLWKKFHWGFSFARKKAWQRKRIVAPLRCRGLIDAFWGKSLAKKLNRVTPSTTCVRNMLSTYIGNRA
ncbi:MAG: hypothetical protein E7057_10200 [Lentisphaerae bacterium]|nr:hypothetical protein [Lentisphaerota bacterium]